MNTVKKQVYLKFLKNAQVPGNAPAALESRALPNRPVTFHVRRDLIRKAAAAVKS